MSLANRINEFNRSLKFTGKLPQGIRIMNPYAENSEALAISSRFYQKYFDDEKPRKLILGINPGRFGAGLTGVPFTDSVRLENNCNIPVPGIDTRELSSVFIYEMIEAFGGPEVFYQRFFVSAVCPLGFVKLNAKGREVNYNYYDSKTLQEAVEPFIIKTLEQQISMGIDTSEAFCLGTGKNFKYLQKLNKTRQYFNKVTPIEHPRYVMQYKLKSKDEYIEKYLKILA